MGLELVGAYCTRFELNQLLFGGDRTLLADLKEKLLLGHGLSGQRIPGDLSNSMALGMQQVTCAACCGAIVEHCRWPMLHSPGY